ncbi:MAG: peptide deformylase [Candidatus Omnitrophica bacterium]|nr:peptide deformylase [Candidatus Omnitrophota bacterium]
MAVLPIHTFPDPLLKIPARPIERITPNILQLIDDLVETMRHHPRCVGLAAPQVGQSVRVAVVDVTGHPKATHPSGLLVFVNPHLIAQDAWQLQREGCLSVPDLTGNVERAVEIRVEALDASGRRWTRRFEGFEAIAIQHEVDHLAGRLFLDRIANIRTDLFRRKRYWFPKNSP